MAHLKRFALALALWGAWSSAVGAQPSAVSSSEPCPGASAPAVSASRVEGDWHAGATVALPWSKPAELEHANDLGPAPAGMRLERMLLLLEPSPAQRQALEQELVDLQTPRACGFHQFLTAHQFAGAYANSASDVTAVAAWLESSGFEVATLPEGRGWIEFSGTVAQVEQAFHAPVHSYSGGAGARIALAGAISVPAALSPVIHGLVSLDGELSSPALTAPKPVQSSLAELNAQTSPSKAEAMTPQLVDHLVQMDTLHGAGTVGTGQRIAIASRSNVLRQDIAAFRSAFGLPASPVAITAEGPAAGPDLGLTADRAATELAASWAGAAAPAAQIIVAPASSTNATDGVDLSLAAIVDQWLAQTVIVGYAGCEAALSEAHQAFYSAIYRQAAAEGIAAIVAVGDSGAAACHAAGSDTAVSEGYGVNGLASTPWNTVVGAAGLDEESGFIAWSPANTGDSAYAGGGGSSTAYAAPAWQAGLSPSARALPDLTLPTGLDTASSPGLAFCFSSSASATGCTLVRSGGSSAAAALFGGVAALIAQKNGPQGNVAPGLYALSDAVSAFHDVQQGNARLACALASQDCDATGHIGYAAETGYDLATGLGVPNAQALLAAWATPDANGTGTTSVTLTASPTATGNIYNPTAAVTFTAVVASTAGGSTPTGSVSFITGGTGNNISIGTAPLDSTGTGSVTVTGGSTISTSVTSITANYSGDTNYAASTSSPLPIAFQPSSTSLAIVPSTTTPALGASLTVTATLTVGTPPAGTASPTGKVTLNLDGTANSTATLTTTAGTSTATFTLTIPTTAGMHTLQAIYAGDANYSASTSSSVTLTVSKGATVTTLTATPSTLTAGTPETLTANVAPLNAVAGGTYTITGSVAFYDGSTPLGTAQLASNTATLSNVTLSTTTSHLITAVYSGDNNWTTSTSTPVSLIAVLLPDSVTLTVAPTAPGPGKVVTLTATVAPSTPPAATAEQNPTGNVVFYDGTTILGTAPLAASQSDTSVAQLLNTTLPSGNDVLTAVYVGDLYYAAATSNSITIDVQGFTIVPSSTNPPTNLDIVKGAAGTASFVVSGQGGFSGQIQIVCSVPTQDDMACTASPQQVTPTATVTFTVQTYLSGGPSSTAASARHSLWPRAAGGSALAALLIFLLPMRRRARLLTDRRRRLGVLLLLLAGLCRVGMGCTSISGQVTNSEGTPLGVATLTITAASNVDNAVVSQSVYLTVNVLPPGSTAAARRNTGVQ